MDKSPEEVEAVLSQVENFKMSRSECTAFNYLIDYVELGHFDGDRLFSLCLEMMQDLLDRNK